MATFNSTTFGAISGRHGSAVAANSKNGKSILKVFKAPTNPNSIKQQKQRTKFGFVNSELSCMRELFKITLGSSRGINQAVSMAMKDAVTGEFPDYAIVYDKLKMTSGSVYGSGLVSAAKTLGTTVMVDWDYTPLSGNSPNDGVSLIFFNEESKEAMLKQNHAERMAQNAEVELPELWAGAKVHCWIYFSTPNGTLNSASQYISFLQL